MNALPSDSVQTASPSILRHKEIIQFVFYQNNNREIHLVRKSPTVSRIGNGLLEETPDRCWALYLNPFIVFDIKTGCPRIGDTSSMCIAIRRDVCGKRIPKIRALSIEISQRKEIIGCNAPGSHQPAHQTSSVFA